MMDPRTAGVPPALPSPPPFTRMFDKRAGGTPAIPGRSRRAERSVKLRQLTLTGTRNIAPKLPHETSCASVLGYSCAAVPLRGMVVGPPCANLREYCRHHPVGTDQASACQAG